LRSEHLRPTPVVNAAAEPGNWQSRKKPFGVAPGRLFIAAAAHLEDLLAQSPKDLKEIVVGSVWIAEVAETRRALAEVLDLVELCERRCREVAA
jgi:hypothetical protein